MHWHDEYFNRLNDRYTAAELADILDLSVEDLWNAFYEQLLDNRFLLTEVGMTDEKN